MAGIDFAHFHWRTGQRVAELLSLGNSDFLGSERRFGQSQFLKTSPCSFNYFKDLNINLK